MNTKSQTLSFIISSFCNISWNLWGMYLLLIQEFKMHGLHVALYVQNWPWQHSPKYFIVMHEINKKKLVKSIYLRVPHSTHILTCENVVLIGWWLACYVWNRKVWFLTVLRDISPDNNYWTSCNFPVLHSTESSLWPCLCIAWSIALNQVGRNKLG